MTKLSPIVAVGLALVLVAEASFVAHVSSTSPYCSRFIPLSMAKSKKEKKSGGRGGGASGGIKGFGSFAPSSKAASSSKNKGVMDRSKEAMAFYDYMERNGAGDNLKRVALGQFPLPGTDFNIRGVMALKDMKKGDVIIRIPYEMAVNLGPEGGDPTLPGKELLQMYCTTLLQHTIAVGLDQSTYFKILPEFMGSDCLGSTDFFTEDALNALQAPLVVEETLQRRKRTRRRYERDVVADDTFPSWIDNTAITEEHLRWAVWLVTSRVLTVQGGEGSSYRLLIPFLDMCNHDRSSPHILTGRAIPGGELKVVAGAPVQAGEQVNICYGGGVAGNDRFLQDYGFLDSGAGAFNIVAQQLLGKRRVMEGSNKGRNMASIDKERTLEELRSTSIEQDEELLSNEVDRNMRAAIGYRMGVKKSLASYNDI